MRLIFGLVVVCKCRKRPQTLCGAGNSVGIQCRIFSEFLRQSVEANGSCRLEYSLQTSGILLCICRVLMMLPPLLPHLGGSI